ncbi:hypothetical protein XENOCAPTIV_003573 [Xenoophorus captivus]|uniref:Uncharacterized protein n=1 Tax=Xenoophorus captivus TaxID=1517983 RepID=A0ABV0QPQ2_9TELE
MFHKKKTHMDSHKAFHCSSCFLFLQGFSFVCFFLFVASFFSPLLPHIFAHLCSFPFPYVSPCFSEFQPVGYIFPTLILHLTVLLLIAHIITLTVSHTSLHCKCFSSDS